MKNYEDICSAIFFATLGLGMLIICIVFAYAVIFKAL